jgi:hypothetical protein
MLVRATFTEGTEIRRGGTACPEATPRRTSIKSTSILPTEYIEPVDAKRTIIVSALNQENHCTRKDESQLLTPFGKNAANL